MSSTSPRKIYIKLMTKLIRYLFIFLLVFGTFIYCLFVTNSIKTSMQHLSSLDYDEILMNNINDLKSICLPKSNIVFLKTHKCASSAIQRIFLIYGYLNDKIFALPSKANYFGHPTPFNRYMLPNKTIFNHEYNIIAHHTRLNYPEMKYVMPSDSLFITILRNPIDLFESMFNYYKFYNIYNLSLEYFNSNNFNSGHLIRNRFAGKIGVNQMLFDMGYDIRKRDISSIPFILKKLDQIFDLVMIAEKMEESLIFLKELLCWNYDEVITFKINARPKKIQLSKLARNRISELNKADQIVYDYFNSKFEKQVEIYGRIKMLAEIKKLRTRIRGWYNYCVEKEYQERDMLNSVIKFKTKDVANISCWLLTSSEMAVTNFIRKHQIEKYPTSVLKN